MESIEEKVDKLLESKCRTTLPKRRLRSRKLLGIPIWILVFMISALIVSATLIQLFGEYHIMQTYSLTTKGIDAGIYIDGKPVTEMYTSMGADEFSDDWLQAGETEEFIHNIEIKEGFGDWIVTFDKSAVEFTEGDYVGYELYILNEYNEEIDYLRINESENKIFKFRHSLDSMFANTTIDIPINIDIIISRPSLPT